MDVFKLFRRLIFASVLIMAANFAAIFLEPETPEAITDYVMADGALLALLFVEPIRGRFQPAQLTHG